MDKNKDWQLELLMEKLRSKAPHFKSFVETSKNVRMTLLDKRYALDSVEKSQHQKCLDTLQHSIKVTSLQSMVERLESLTRQLGLKFVQRLCQNPTGYELFITSDVFYLEIILQESGAVHDVKVHHEGKEPQNCQELVECLTKGDFSDFTAQLEGFASIYQLNAEKKVKCKAFSALQSLEADLCTLAQLQTFIKEPFNVLYKSPVGILEKRRGGHAMKLTYFVSPYDLINKDRGDIDPIAIDGIISKNLGYNVTVYMEGSTAHKLQTSTLITVNRNHNGKGTPSYAPLSSQNSAVIPACFVLRLNKSMPICLNLIHQIQQITELDCADISAARPMLSLIATHCSDGKLDTGNNRACFVTLPDQSHCYFMTENKNMQGVLVNNIPFTHPGHVAQILVILRQQALFNTVISSCIRPNSRQDYESMIMLEVSALSWTHISVSLEHPLEESMATAEMDLSDVSNLTCRIHSPGTPPPPNSPDVASDITTKVFNRCFSIPVTMRAILMYWDKQIVRKNHYGGHENFNLPLGSGDPGGRNGNSGNNIGDFDGKIKQEPSSHGGMNLPLMSHPHQGMFLSETLMSSANFTNFQTAADSAAVLTNIELTNILAGNEKPKRSSKRKANDDLWKGSSKTRKAVGGDDDGLLDASSCDSTSRSTPLSQETVSEIPTPNSGLGFHSDLELSALDPSELLGDKDNAPEFDQDDLGDVEEILSGKSRKGDKLSPLGDFGDKLVPPSVSITPIPQVSGFGTNQQGCMDHRPGIEIIPISTTATTLPSSITITPISSQAKGEERSKDKKSNKSRSDDKNKMEKKKKRKREESPMGPPEKIPTKQDPLTKPVSVSIKPAESPPLPSITPNSPNMIRKFSQSPTHNRTMSLSGKLSPSMMKPGLKTHSPKHSPAHVPSSPKHGLPAISSPKSHSPKHPSTSGSGKPSMSTLKNAANSPSSKSGESKNKSKDSSREKDKKTSGSNFSVNSTTKNKSSFKVKPLDLNAVVEIPTPDGLSSPGGMDLSKSAVPNQMRNRNKACLSAIVDKLKSAQHCDIPSSDNNKCKERTGQISKTDMSKNTKTGEPKNPEYMVKHSSDLKVTINKTRMKEPASSKSSNMKSSGTGLKPGVNSGPASKKPQQVAQKTGIVNSTSASGGSSSYSSGSSFKSSTKVPSTKSSSSSGSGSSSLGTNMSKSKIGLPKTSSSSSITDMRVKDRPKLNKSSSEKSIFSSRERKGSPTQQPREESENEKAYKTLSNYATPLTTEGVSKQFDKKFQIPKLSARSSEDKKLLTNKVNTDMNNITRPEASKIYDMFSKGELPKYPLAVPTPKMFDGNMEVKIRNSMNANSLSISARSSSPKLPKDMDNSSDGAIDDKKTMSKDDLNFKMHFPISASKNFQSASEPLSLSTKSIDLTSKFIAPAPKDDIKKDGGKKLEDGLLDYSKLDKSVPLGPPNSYPASPSVSVHIVKSPAPSPLINPSPHSASPGITDDELMDEALVGLGK